MDISDALYKTRWIEELTEENNQLKAELQDAIEQHNEVVLEACQLRTQVAELKSAQTPRPMSEAPKDGKIIRGEVQVRWSNESSAWVHGPLMGWLPLPVDQGDSDG